MERLLGMALRNLPSPEDLEFIKRFTDKCAIAADEGRKLGVFIRLPKHPPFEIPEAYLVLVAKWIRRDKATALDILGDHMRRGVDFKLTPDFNQHEDVRIAAQQECVRYADAPMPEIYAVTPPPVPHSEPPKDVPNDGVARAEVVEPRRRKGTS